MWQSIISAISSPVTQWLKTSGEVKQAKHTRNLAVINNQARLAEDTAQYNHAWEMESLKGNPKWLRVLCFLQIALPLNIAVISPETGNAIWANLDNVPGWYVQLYMIVIGAVWGVHEFKQAAPAVIGSVIKGFK